MKTGNYWLDKIENSNEYKIFFIKMPESFFKPITTEDILSFKPRAGIITRYGKAKVNSAFYKKISLKDSNE